MSEAGLNRRGFFFDLDGTIVDSREAYLEAARAAFEFIGQDSPNPKIALEIPKRLEQRLPIDDIVNSNKRVFLDHYLKTYYSITRTKTKPWPNVESTLEFISKRANLGLITMRYVSSDSIRRELELFKIAKYFMHVTTALETSKPKPSPEALIQCEKAIGINLCNCTIVGDSISDVRAGKNAGIKTIAVLTGLFSYEELEKEHPDLILDSINSIPRLLE